MKIRKKLYSAALALIVTILFSAPAVTADGADARLTPVKSGDDAIEIIDMLGIYQGDAKDAYAISRIEYAVVIARALGYEASNIPDEDPYKDFLKYEYASGEVSYLKERGIMIGDEEDCFHPDEPIDAQSALIVGARALGYNYKIVSSPSPTIAALRVARDADLDKGIDKSLKKINETDLKKIVYNILCADYMEWEESAGAPLLTAVWKLERVEGILSANDVTGLYYAGDKCRKDCVMIGEESYTDGNGEGRKLLGRNVTAFVGNGTDEIQYIYETNNKTLFSWEEQFTYGNFDLSYQNDDGKTIKYSLDQRFAFIYNGKSIVFDESFFDEEEVEITLIDSDEDGLYDVVMVESYTYDIVKSVNLRLCEIVCKYSNESVQAETDDNVIVELYYNDIRTNDIESVPERSLIKYYASEDFNKVCIYDSENITGVLNGKNKNYALGSY